MVSLKNLKYGFSIKQLSNYLKFKSNNRKSPYLTYRPIWLLIYVSDLCNLKCAMCPHHSGKNDKFEFKKQLGNKFISIEMLEKIYKKFPESIFVMLGGVGEPLVHPQFKEIVTLTAKHKKKINIITNGTKLDESMATHLLSEKMVNQISVSLNASNEKEYSAICNVNGKMFYTVTDNIKTLVRLKKELNSKTEIVVSGVCSHEFFESSFEFLKYCDELGVDRIDLHRYIDFNIDDAFNDIDEHNIELKKLYDYAKDKIKTKCNLPHIINEKSYNLNCDWYFKNLSFDAKGNMGSCGRVINPDKTYGNIDDKEDIWNNQYMKTMRKKFLTESHLTKYCDKCVENYKD